MPERGLRYRILVSFAGFGVLFTCGVVLFMFMSYQAGLEAAAQKMLVDEVRRLQAAREQDPATPLPHTAYLRAFVGEAAVPEPYRSNLHRFEAEDYEVPLREWREVQMWTGRVAGATEPVYVFLDFGSSRDREIFTPNLLRALLLAAVLFLAFSLWLAWAWSRRLARPLSKLAEQLARYHPDRPLDLAEPDLQAGEVGTVARAFDVLHRRMRRFIDREKEFTRNASHELRTPITVIQGAHDVLRRALPDPDPRVSRALDAVEQAAEEMSTLVDSFLWLAREETEPEREAVCPTGEVIRLAVERHRILLAERPVEVSVRLETETHPDVPRHLFRIAVNNLVRNAFQYTRRGRVEIVGSGHGFEIADTGPGVDPALLAQVGQAHVRGPDSPGFGLGLGIVDRIARRCGWAFSLENRPGGGTVARLTFEPTDRTPP